MLMMNRRFLYLHLSLNRLCFLFSQSKIDAEKGKELAKAKYVQ